MTFMNFLKSLGKLLMRLAFGVTALLIILFVAATASNGVRSELADVQTKAQLAAARASHNEKQIEELEKKLAQAKPVVVVKKETNAKTAKPFNDDDLLRRARKLRNDQKKSRNED
jgi:uncharacterized membrane protein